MVCIIHQNEKNAFNKIWLDRNRGGNIALFNKDSKSTTGIVCYRKFYCCNIIGSPVPSSSEWTADYDDWDVTGGRTGWFSVLSNGSVPAILMPQNHSHDLPPTPSPEQIKQMEEETHRQFELLKVSACFSIQI